MAGVAASASRSERISPLVGRRDPLGVGRRPGCASGASRLRRAPAPRCPGRPPGGGARSSWPVGRYASHANALGERLAGVCARACPTPPGARCRPGMRSGGVTVSRLRR